MSSTGLMGLDTPGYSGVIRLGSKPIQVQNGVFHLAGKRFYVSDKGEVTDEEDKAIAVVKNGNLMPMPGQQQQQQQAPEGMAA